MFIQTEETPNPATMKFLPGREVMKNGTLDITEARAAAASPLAEALFGIDGVKGVFLGSDFVTVTRAGDQNWPALKPAILAAIMDHFTSNRPIVTDAAPAAESPHAADESEIAKQIREILDVKVRPAVAQDGGDITFQSFEDGVVYLNLKGSCAGCPSSTATLKAGIENMLKHYIPEVKEVRQVAESSPYMHIALISGSHRKGSQSGRITQYLAARLQKLDQSTTADIIDLVGNPLPLWDDENNSHATSPALQKQWQPYAERLQKAEGFVVISPEWHGMVPAGLKNFFLYCSVKDVGHKPALITTVSVSRNGAYPVAELRMSSYKNNRLCYIPEHLIVRDAANVFAGDAPANKDDEFLRDRADFSLRVLLDYAKALKAVRGNGALYERKYSSGM